MAPEKLISKLGNWLNVHWVSGVLTFDEKRQGFNVHSSVNLLDHLIEQSYVIGHSNTRPAQLERTENEILERLPGKAWSITVQQPRP